MNNVADPADGSTSAAALEKSAPRLGARLAVWLVLAVVVVHSAAVALWVGPDSLMRDKIGVDRLKSYILPMFDQSWSVFAPEADFGYELFEIRGTLSGPDGKTTVTPWVKVTRREVAPGMVHHPFPSRSVLMSTRLATDHVGVFRRLTPAQQAVVARATSSVSLPQLRTQLEKAATNPLEKTRADEYMGIETSVEYFLSGVADGIWGRRLQAVQFRRNRILVTNYVDQQGRRTVETGYLFLSNWRPVHALSGSDRTAFTSYDRTHGIR